MINGKWQAIFVICYRKIPIQSGNYNIADSVFQFFIEISAGIIGFIGSIFQIVVNFIIIPISDVGRIGNGRIWWFSTSDNRFCLIGYGREPVRQVLPRGCAIFHINGIFAGTDKDAFSCCSRICLSDLSKHAGNNNFSAFIITSDTANRIGTVSANCSVHGHIVKGCTAAHCSDDTAYIISAQDIISGRGYTGINDIGIAHLTGNTARFTGSTEVHCIHGCCYIFDRSPGARTASENFSSQTTYRCIRSITTRWCIGSSSSFNCHVRDYGLPFYLAGQNANMVISIYTGIFDDQIFYNRAIQDSKKANILKIFWNIYNFQATDCMAISVKSTLKTIGYITG